MTEEKTEAVKHWFNKYFRILRKEYCSLGAVLSAGDSLMK